MALIKDVQVNGTAVGVTSLACTAFTPTTAVGDVIVVFEQSFNGGAAAGHNAPTDTLGNTYTNIGTATDGAHRSISMWQTTSASAGANTVTAHYAATVDNSGVCGWLLDGTVITGGGNYNGDVVTNVVNPNGTTNTLSVDPTNPNGLSSIHLGGILDSPDSTTVGSGFNGANNGFNSGTMSPRTDTGGNFCTEFKVSASAETPTWTGTSKPLYLAICASFLIAGAPTVTNVSPADGSTAGGDPVTITGTRFNSAVSDVKFGGNSATSVVWVNSTTITCVTPNHAAGQVNVVVTNPNTLSGTLVNGYTYHVPIVSSSSPSSGTTKAQAVTITGQYFSLLGVQVFVDSLAGPAATSVVVVSNTSITCVLPAHAAGAVAVYVQNTTGGQDSGSATIYTYHNPTISNVSPDLSSVNGSAVGSFAGGSTATVTGTFFASDIVVTFEVDASHIATATNVVVAGNGLSLTCTIPRTPTGGGNTDQTVNVRVTQQDSGHGGTAVFTFIYEHPRVTSLNITIGPTAAAAQTVTITGQYFDTGDIVTFDGIAASNVVVVSDTSITYKPPAHVAGAVNVRVTFVTTTGISPYGELVNGYTYSNPILATLTPTDAALSARTVTMAGQFFATGYTVTVGGVLAAGVTIVSDIAITYTTPAHAPGGVAVVVNGNFADSNPLTYTYHAPEPATVTPANGPLIGIPVTIAGVYFTGADTSRIFFGGSAATGVTVVSDVSITCTTPGHAAGTVDLEVFSTQAGGGYSGLLPNAYTYHSPVVSTVTPNKGALVGGTPVTIAGTYFTGVQEVHFGGITGTSFTEVSDISITVTTPAHIPGFVDVDLFSTFDFPNQGGTLVDGFEYKVPTPTSVTPNRGPTIGGTPVTIAGLYLTGSTRAYFGGTPATAYTVLGDTAATCTTPAHTFGLVDVETATLMLDPYVGSMQEFRGLLVGGFFYMARGWWYSTNAFDGDVTAVDSVAGEKPGEPRDWSELAFTTIGNGDYLGGSPSAACVKDNKLVYVAGGYTVGTDTPSIRYFDGVVDRELCKVPPTAAGVICKAVVSLLTANNTIYFSTLDNNTGTSNWAGRVFELDMATGVMTLQGDDVFTSGQIPYALCWYQSKLWVGTNRGDTGAAVGRVYWIRPGIDTTWTLDHTMTGNQGSVTCLLPWHDDLYVGLMAASTFNALLLKRSTTDGSYATSDTMPDTSPANNNSFPALAVFNDVLYNSSYNPARKTYIRKLSSGTWSSVSTTASATCVPYIGLFVDSGYLFALGAKALTTHTVLFRTPDGTSYTDETSFLDASPAPIGPAWGAVTVS